jgi:hypothetical protein
MPAYSPGRDDKLYQDLAMLKRHLNYCKQCKAARKAADPHAMCGLGATLVLKSAERFDQIIRLRVAAHNGPDHTVFACPDLSKHGKSYAVTAEPLVVTGVQGGLW